MRTNCKVKILSSGREVNGSWVEGPIRVNFVGFPAEEDLIIPGKKFFIISGYSVHGPYELDDPRFVVEKL